VAVHADGVGEVRVGEFVRHSRILHFLRGAGKRRMISDK
jgi:hypothetical protein